MPRKSKRISRRRNTRNDKRYIRKKTIRRSKKTKKSSKRKRSLKKKSIKRKTRKTRINGGAPGDYTPNSGYALLQQYNKQSAQQSAQQYNRSESPGMFTYERKNRETRINRKRGEECDDNNQCSSGYCRLLGIKKVCY